MIIRSIFAACTVLIVVQLGWIFFLTTKGNYKAVPYTQNVPNARLDIAFLGDSTAVGTGAADNRDSVAGYFGRDFPQAHITNDSYNGRVLQQLEREFTPGLHEHYDLVVMQIGGNDILKFTPYSKIQRNLHALLAKVRPTTSHMVLMHTGNVGEAPVFIWPFYWIMTERTRKVREIYKQEAAQSGAVYIDLFEAGQHDPFVRTRAFYAPDLLHPSGAGYRFWYDQIQKALAQAGVDITKTPVLESRP